jgi:hypothetical protein
LVEPILREDGLLADYSNLVGVVWAVLPSIAQLGSRETSGAISALELAVRALLLLFQVIWLLTHQLVRSVLAISLSIAAIANIDTLLSISTAVLVLRTSILDLQVRRPGTAFLLVAAIKALVVPIADTAPSETPGVVDAHEAFAVIDDGAESSLVRAVSAIIGVVAKHCQGDARPISAHEL